MLSNLQTEMDVQKLIAELEAERNRINEAIAALERLAASKGKRRGRPPKHLAAGSSTETRDYDVESDGAAAALSRAAASGHKH